MYCTPVLFIVQLAAYLDNPGKKKKNRIHFKRKLRHKWQCSSFSSYLAIIVHPQRRGSAKLPSSSKFINTVCFIFHRLKTDPLVRDATKLSLDQKLHYIHLHEIPQSVTIH